MIRVIAFGALMLAGCQMQDTSDGEMQAACIAPDLQQNVGAPLTALDIQSLPQPNRVIGPDMAVTMDWNPARLNIEYDSARIITRIYCG